MNFSNVKKITIDAGDVKQIAINGVVVWQGYTNLVPTSTDTDGSIYNGVGYKDGVRLSSSGGISSSSQPAGTTTGFIPWNGADTDIIRMKGVEWLGAAEKYNGHFYINFYDGNKKFLDYFSSQDYSVLTHVVTVTRDSNGVEMVDFNESYGTSNVMLQAARQSKYIRITAAGKGANMEVTINEEIA